MSQHDDKIEEYIWLMMKCMASGLGQTPSAAKKQAANELFYALSYCISLSQWRSLYYKLIHQHISPRIDNNKICYDWIIQLQKHFPNGNKYPEKLSNYPNSPPRSLWGPTLWIIMKHIAKSLGKYPTKHQQKCVRDYFYALCELLACGHCRQHYTKLIYNDEPLHNDYLKCDELCYNWVLRIENHVRKVKFISYENENENT